MKIEGIGGYIKILLLYTSLIFLAGIIKTEILIENQPHSIKGIARISSILSIFISTISLLFILLIESILVWFLIQLHKIYVPISEWFYCLKFLIFSLIGSEILKFMSLYLFLVDDIKNINLTLANSYEKMSFFWVSRISDFMFLILGIVLFSIEMKNVPGNSFRTSFFAVTYFSISISLIFLLFNT
jgi:hypothetical protein